MIHKKLYLIHKEKLSIKVVFGNDTQNKNYIFFALLHLTKWLLFFFRFFALLSLWFGYLDLLVAFVDHSLAMWMLKSQKKRKR
jgi:hypothetical protein